MDPCQLPYAHLNLRQNPFGELCAADWTALARVDVKSITLELTDPHIAVQFVGEKGYGKTTHLLAIRAQFANAAYVHIPEGQRIKVPVGNPVLIDEAQRLTLWQQVRVFRQRVPLVLGTHRDFTKSLQRAGRRVQTIHVQYGTNVQRLYELANARIAWARRSSGPVPTVTQETAQELLRKFGPDLRSSLHELYVRFQNLARVCDV
ncbi:MAG: hypothetical protein R3C59_23070 [Planctomycetaceae bacterium]